LVQTGKLHRYLLLFGPPLGGLALFRVDLAVQLIEIHLIEPLADNRQTLPKALALLAHGLHRLVQMHT
jgi:hypothetical protein